MRWRNTARQLVVPFSKGASVRGGRSGAPAGRYSVARFPDRGAEHDPMVLEEFSSAANRDNPDVVVDSHSFVGESEHQT